MPRENQLSRHIIRCLWCLQNETLLRLYLSVRPAAGYTHEASCTWFNAMTLSQEGNAPSSQRSNSHVLKPAYYQNKNPALKEFFVGAMPNQPPSSSQIVWAEQSAQTCRDWQADAYLKHMTQGATFKALLADVRKWHCLNWWHAYWYLGECKVRNLATFAGDGSCFSESLF